MNFREATIDDLRALSETTISRGQKTYPAQVSWVYTLEHEGMVLASGGFMLLTHHTAWCWLNLSKASLKHTYTVYRVIKEWLDQVMREKDLWRMMAAVECDFPRAIHTVEHLGFTRESTMPEFFDGSDAFMYVKILDKG